MPSEVSLQKGLAGCRSGKLLSERRLGCRDRLPDYRRPESSEEEEGEEEESLFKEDEEEEEEEEEEESRRRKRRSSTFRIHRIL